VSAPQPVRAAKVEEKPVPQRIAREAAAQESRSASSEASGWAVQLGSFASRINAQRLVKQLKAKGFSAFVVAGGGSSGKLYRVRVGPQPDRAAAGALASKLRSAGYKGGAVVSQP
jgi:DedD protein